MCERRSRRFSSHRRCWRSFPAATFAQSNSNIAGVVKDTTGAVLPGVTVEAASPALIEKVRSVVTDSAGQYKIVNLVPGVYTRDVHAARLQHRPSVKASS